jgi:hypothetical protein
LPPFSTNTTSYDACVEACEREMISNYVLRELLVLRLIADCASGKGKRANIDFLGAESGVAGNQLVALRWKRSSERGSNDAETL